MKRLIKRIAKEAIVIENLTDELRSSAFSHGLKPLFPKMAEEPTAADILKTIGKTEAADFLKDNINERLRKIAAA